MMFVLLQKQISSAKHTGFEDSLFNYISLGLPLSAGFFFVRIFLTPDSETNESIPFFKTYLRSVYHRPFLCDNPNKNE